MQFALCYHTVACLSCPVCDIDVLWPNGWTDQDENAGRPRPWPHCVRWGTQLPLPQRELPPNFWPISVVAKWLDGSRCHLVWRKDSAQAPVLDGDPAPPPLKEGGALSPIFGPCPLWPNGWMDQDATQYGGRPQPRRVCVRWEPSPPSQKGSGAPSPVLRVEVENFEIEPEVWGTFGYS